MRSGGRQVLIVFDTELTDLHSILRWWSAIISAGRPIPADAQSGRFGCLLLGGLYSRTLAILATRPPSS